MSDNYSPFKVNLAVEVYVQIEDWEIEDARELDFSGKLANMSDDEVREHLAQEKAIGSVGFVGSFADQTTEVNVKGAVETVGL